VEEFQNESLAGTEITKIGDPKDDDISGMTPAQLEEAKAIGRRELIASLLGRALDLVYLVSMVVLIAQPDSGYMLWLKGFSDSSTVQLTLLTASIITGNLLVSFPLSLYAGHILQHQYHLSRQSFLQWIWRKAKGFFLEMIFSLVLVIILYWIIWMTQGWWWLVAAVGFFFLSVVLGQLAPVLILPIFYKIKLLDPTDQQGPELNRIFKQLTGGTGLSVEGVYRMDLSAETNKANAMLAGLGRTRRVILADTLLDHFSLDEIAVIFAHEVGHHVHHHIRKMILFGGVYSLTAFYLCDLVVRRWLEDTGVVANGLDYANLPIFVLPVLLLTIHLFSTLLEPLQNSLSRHFERQADRFAIDVTQHREAYLSAFSKLAKQNKDDPRPHRLEVLLFHSHPPIAERIAMARY
tara:strand:- start:651 stop:1871 length:1221 start_codon:yes stop_codon:yes gene_type:complete